MNLWLLNDRDWHPPQAVLNASGATVTNAAHLLDLIETGRVEVRVRDGRPEVRLRWGHQVRESAGETVPARPPLPPEARLPSYK